MVILITNDDGIDSPGLGQLCEVGAQFGDVWVVAPMEDQSARSHAVTMHTPLRATEVRPRWFGVNGTPVDCVLLALHHILPVRPRLVLSGINRGANVGDDIHYSGTVASAMQACLLGIPSVAVSLFITSGDGREELCWQSAAHYAGRVVKDVLAHHMPPSTVLNLNIPNLPISHIHGLRTCRLGLRRYRGKVDVRRDPRGRNYYWLGGDYDGFHDLNDSDGPLVEAGYATLTPLQLDMTAHDQLTFLAHWPSVCMGR